MASFGVSLYNIVLLLIIAYGILFADNYWVLILALFFAEYRQG